MCKCDADWAIYDDTIQMTGDFKFYFIASCDQCGALLRVHCSIDRFEDEEEWTQLRVVKRKIEGAGE